MNVAQYYEKVRAVEGSFASEYVWITSEATRDGGIAGRTVEVSRATAAKLIVQGKGRLATAEESEAARQHDAAEIRRAELQLPSEFVVGDLAELE
ncbi:MAG: hypothetical protein IPJ98_08425 [Bryobacterales bacterium]|nr:hypothetical protein [Bryobacterales bacterium]